MHKIKVEISDKHKLPFDGYEFHNIAKDRIDKELQEFQLHSPRRKEEASNIKHKRMLYKAHRPKLATNRIGR